MDEVDQIDIYLPKLSNTNRMLVLSKVGISTEGKTDVTSKRCDGFKNMKKNIEDLEKKHLRSTGKHRE